MGCLVAELMAMTSQGTWRPGGVATLGRLEQFASTKKAGKENRRPLTASGARGSARGRLEDMLAAAATAGSTVAQGHLEVRRSAPWVWGVGGCVWSDAECHHYTPLSALLLPVVHTVIFCTYTQPSTVPLHTSRELCAVPQPVQVVSSLP